MTQTITDTDEKSNSCREERQVLKTLNHVSQTAIENGYPGLYGMSHTCYKGCHCCPILEDPRILKDIR